MDFAISSYAQPFTVVMSFRSTSGPWNVMSTFGLGANNIQLLYSAIDGHTRLNTESSLSIAGQSTGVDYVVSFVMNGASSLLRRNGTQASGNAGTRSLVTPIRFNTSESGDRSWGNRIYQVRVYQGALTADQISAIEANIATMFLPIPPATSTITDEFNGPYSPNWQWVNKGTSASIVSNSLQLVTPVATQNTFNFMQDFRGVSGDWQVETKLLAFSGGAAAGIIAYNENNGRLEGASPATYLNKVYFQRWTSFTVATNPAETALTPPCYLRLSKIGTNLVLAYSTNGTSWTTGYTDALASHLLEVTHCGLSIQANTTATFDYFRFTQL
jgi:hypothetical protein